VDRRTRTLFVVALVAVVLLSGGAALLLGDGSQATPGPSIEGPSMVGVVVSVDARSLGDVRGFQLRRQDGVVVDFQLGQLENATTFPPGHLAEHQATAAPVRVVYRTEGDQLFAIRLEDAAR
jgi:hypothetical protein